ncbi:MAG: hypothetical protein GY703_19795, partial [Gammaproteobacteria bacterium]|nr:hypothetical protein [Gammaproteobacteria bacterium]
NGAPINLANGVELGVNTAQTVSTGDFTLPELAAGDVISLQVRAVGGHKNSVPQVSGGVTPSAVSVVGVLNPDAKLHVASRDSATGGGAAEISVANLSLPYTWVIGTDAVIDSPQPLLVEFFTDPGLEITLDNIYARNSHSGWEITLNDAPDIGEAIIMRDLTATNGIPAEVRHINEPATSTPFEFQTPFTDSELDQLYWAQANDIMWFCHEDHKPWRLTRRSHYEWVWDQPTLYGAPWDLPGTSWQADGVAEEYEFYFSVSSKANMKIFANGELVDAADWDLATGHTFPVKDNATVKFTEAPHVGTNIMITSIVSDYNPAFGYPRCVVFFQERL